MQPRTSWLKEGEKGEDSMVNSEMKNIGK